MVTTQFFGGQAPALSHDQRRPPGDAGEVAAKASDNGALTRTPGGAAMTVEEILASPMLAHPLPSTCCAHGRGAARARALPARVPRATPGGAAGLARSAVFRTWRAGRFEVFSRRSRSEIARRLRRRCPRGIRGSPSGARGRRRRAGTGHRSGAELIHLAECGFCDTASRPVLYASGATSIGGRLPVNTDGGCLANGEPVGDRPAAGLRGSDTTPARAGERQVPGDPRIGFTQVYGRTRGSACNVLEA